VDVGGASIGSIVTRSLQQLIRRNGSANRTGTGREEEPGTRMRLTESAAAMYLTYELINCMVQYK
jgi:hypothetical protein